MRALAAFVVFGLMHAVVPAADRVPAPDRPQPSHHHPPPTLRFHHLHYAVPDPGAAMNEAAAKLRGTRVVAQGLGAGVRVGDEYVLYDRAGEADSSAATAADVAGHYAAAVAWLQARGVDVDPPHLSASRIAQAPAGAFRHIGFAAGDFDTAVAAVGATPLKRTSDLAVFEAGGRLVEIVRETDAPDAFWCAMHPDVRSATPGECPLCRMSLVPIPTPKVGEYRLDVSLDRGRSGVTRLQFAVAEPGTDTRVRAFTTVHEKLFHLFIVSRDLEYFAHVHPEATPDGTFVLEQALPPGEYMLVADFLPAGGTPQMVQRAVIVSGARRPGSAARGAASGRLGPTFEDGGVRGVLAAENLIAGKESRLTITFSDVASGAPVTDLEPYLGAPAHMLMVRSDLSDAAHEHPEETAAGGPVVSFHPIIPAAGDYRLWVQVQRRGRVLTFPFAFRAGQ